MSECTATEDRLDRLEFDLMHIADSALPVGGFAFSNGLESAAKFGIIRSRPALDAYLRDYSQQLMELELPFLAAIHREAQGQTPALAHLIVEWTATFSSEAMQRGSLRQGNGMLNWLERVHPELGMQALAAWFKAEPLRAHYLPVFAIGMARLGLPRKRTERLFLFMALRDQTSAAVRLGLLGPMDAQCLLHRLLAAAQESHALSTLRDYTHAVRSCPLIEWAQGSHDQLYSRLFQS
ncbi:MAG: hypothetical protein O3C57_00065 [Verrucomicrobia bacterium]|nr:hypothetical protein [Verrucomicrobiota bacterium]